MVTDLTITGKVAQYGRGVLADVSAKLLDQFVERLEADVLSGGPDEAPPADAAAPASPNGKGAPDGCARDRVAAGGADRSAGRRRCARGQARRAARRSRLPRGLAVAPTPPRPSCRAPDADDLTMVTALLGRPPRGEFEIVVRAEGGRPVVICNAPLLDDGTPMPTRWWLVGEPEAPRRCPARGGRRGATRPRPPSIRDELAAAHARYAAERDAAIPAGHDGPRPSGGVGGTRTGVKCLHAHYAWFLAGGDDPVGRWIDEKLQSEWGAAGVRRLRRSTAGRTRPGCW